MPRQLALGFGRQDMPPAEPGDVCRGHWLHASGASLWRCQTRQYATVASVKTGDECDVCRRPVKVHPLDPGHGVLDDTGTEVYLARWGEWERLKWANR